MRRVSIGALLLVATGCTGGGVVLPKTYPAVGTVVYKGGQPMTGGSVQFISTDDPLLRVMGTIETDGRFTLSTTKDSAKADGAPEGLYTVHVVPPAASDTRGNVPAGHKGVIPTVLAQPLRIEARENTLKIELPTAPPRS